MEITVFSDSHGNERNILKVLNMKKGSDLFLHIGDGAPSFLLFADSHGLVTRAVKGNCDTFTSSLLSYPLEEEELFTLDDKIIFITHGHKYSVSYSLDRLIYAAYEKNADIVVYGHTHSALTKYIPSPDGKLKPLYILNPGSISKPRDGGAPSFGTISISKGGILLNTARVE